jgi:hypothetical protein
MVSGTLLKNIRNSGTLENCTLPSPDDFRNPIQNISNAGTPSGSIGCPRDPEPSIYHFRSPAVKYKESRDSLGKYRAPSRPGAQTISGTPSGSTGHPWDPEPSADDLRSPVKKYKQFFSGSIRHPRDPEPSLYDFRSPVQKYKESRDPLT